MKKIILNFALAITFLIGLNSCAQEPKKQFDQVSLEEVLQTPSNEKIKFSDILKKHESQIIVLDIWASWCKDCITGMPKLKELQKNNPEVVFLFLSMDKTHEKWIDALAKYNLEGEHYLVSEGMKGAFGKSVNLDWIPRYMVIDQKSNIALYKAIEADDANIQTTINNLKNKK